MSQRNNTNLISISALIAIIFLMLMTQACTKKSSPPPAPTDQDAQGLFTTNTSKNTVTATFANPPVVEPLNAIKGMVYGVLPNQKFIFFDVASNVLYDGVISAITLTDVTGTATVYHDGVMVSANIAVTGTVTNSSTVSLTFATSGDFTGGTIEGLFIQPASIYNRTATTARTDSLNNSFRWNTTNSGGVQLAITGMGVTNFDVASNDTYSFASVKIGVRCDHNGTLVSGNTKNIYTILNNTLDPSVGDPCSLPAATNYSGFASVVAENSSGNGVEMWYATTNGTNSIFAVLKR